MAEAAPTRVVRPVRRGQITIPIEFRRKLGIEDDTLLQVTLRDDRIEIAPVVTRPAHGSAWARELYDYFAPVRADLESMDADELDTLIDTLVDEVRSESYAARRP